MWDRRGVPRSLLAMRHRKFLISTAESALAGIVAQVPVGSAPELAHKTTGPPRSCRACGTYPRGRNAPNNSSPIRHVPTRRIGELLFGAFRPRGYVPQARQDRGGPVVL